MSAVRVQRVVVQSQPGLRVVSRTRSNVLELIAFRTLAFSFIAAVVFFASSLSGQVMVEKARRDGLRAVARTRAVRIAAVSAREEVASLLDSRQVDRWAAENGFVVPGLPAEHAVEKVGKNLVAHNP